MKSRRVVLAGGSAQVGRVLARHFHSRGDSVVVLSRKPTNEPWPVAKWDGVTIGPWIEELNNADLVINLAGRSVNCRYNSRNRREILESRLKSTEILGRAIQQVPHPPRLWLNASTATIYRHALDRPMDEFTGDIDIVQPNAPSTWNFSIEVATQWEETFFQT
ncbi:MAG TPA: NAD-dependent epimerase/dehydratase family protein [Candidatus Acidoferrum sp.]